MPLISIIVPVYNSEKTINRCIDSILNQTFHDWELLLIDDGSNDQSSKICNQYAAADQRIKVFHKENGGVSSARNLGLDNVRGQYVHFVDADDWVEKEMYSSIFSQQNIADLIYFSNFEHMEDGTVVIFLATSVFCISRQEIERTILYLKKNNANYPFFGFTWNKIFKMDIIKKQQIRFIPDFALFEDEIFTDAYCKYIKSMEVLSNPYYHYQRTSSGLTVQPRRTKDLLVLINEIIKLERVFSFRPLIFYEQQRALMFLRKAMAIDFNQHYFVEEKLYLKRIIEMDSSINIGKRLRLINILGFNACKLLLKIYYKILKRPFILG